jgi:hypothetical protein
MRVEPNVEILGKEAASIAEILAKHNVFGVAAEDASPEEKADLAGWVGHEKLHFVGMVLRHALDPQAFLPQTLQYHDTGAWVRFNTYELDGTVFFRVISVGPLLLPSRTLVIDPKIDYEALTVEVREVIKKDS